MADSFTHVAPDFQPFKDGETVRARKLEAVVSGVQEGLAELERAVGDVHGREVALSGTPLHQNSVGRAIGPMGAVHPAGQPDTLLGQAFADDRARGTALWPASPLLAALAAATATNRVPLPGSPDGVGLGCIHDDGTNCASGCALYAAKSLGAAPLFGGFLEGWTPSGCVGSGAQGVILSNKQTLNRVPFSENFAEWELVGPVAVEGNVIAALDGRNGGGTLSVVVPTADPAGIQCTASAGGSGSGGSSATDWTLSFQAKPLDGDRALVFVPLNPSLASWSASCDARRWGDYLVIELFGPEWREIHVRQTFDYPIGPPAVGIFLQGTKLAAEAPDGVCLACVQFEASAVPTRYARTVGWSTGYHEAAASLTQTVETVPGRTYRLRADVQWPSGLFLSVDGRAIAVPADSGILAADFVATASGHAVGLGFLAPDIDGPLSGVVASLVVTDGPCHRFDCPSFSAYGTPRRYKIVPPTISRSGALQGRPYRFPDLFGLTPDGTLPENVAGIFDAGINEMVPDGLTAWSTADSGTATVMTYDGAVLGRVFTTVGLHASGENLLAWSDHPELWDLVSAEALDRKRPGPDGDLTAWRIASASGVLVQAVPSGLLVDATACLAVWARSATPATATLSVAQGGTGLASSGLDLGTGWRRYALPFSGIQYVSGADLSVEIDASGTVEFAGPTLAHGLAAPDPVRTGPAPAPTYRRRFDLAFAPEPGRYFAGLNGGRPMPATLSGTVLAFDGAGYFTRENDRTNAVRVDLYKDSGEGKYALVQTPLPLARAVGTLAAAFVGHVANENWHFDRSRVCAAIVDPGRWCRSDATRVETTVSANDITEGQLLTLNAKVCGLVPNDAKTVTVAWGDGSSEWTVASGTAFGPFQHAYALPRGNQPSRYTIALTVEDPGLGVSVAGMADVVVRSTTKAVQAAGSLLVAVRAAAQSAKAILKQ